MAASSMRDIKTRIHSVESTRQITKAMELVASSKLVRAKQRMETSKAFFDLLQQTIDDIINEFPEKSSPYMRRREKLPVLFIVIGGDRGLAGGYNSNVIKLTSSKVSELKAESGCDVLYLPIGKRMTEHFSKIGNIIPTEFDKAEHAHTGECRKIGEAVVKGFEKGQFGKVFLVYTKFVSVLTQEPCIEQILPFSLPEKKSEKAKQLPIYEPGPAEVLDIIVPQYISGMLYGAVCESVASECAARRTAMDSATKNADAMIDELSLHYNRARQAAITQEITEIVSGADSQ